MAGLATSMITVSDFVEGLKRSGLFNNIEMKETAQDDRVKDLKAYSWEINAEIVLPPSTDSKAAGAPPQAGKAK